MRTADEVHPAASLDPGRPRFQRPATRRSVRLSERERVGQTLSHEEDGYDLSPSAIGGHPCAARRARAASPHPYTRGALRGVSVDGGASAAAGRAFVVGRPLLERRKPWIEQIEVVQQRYLHVVSSFVRLRHGAR